ncbi:MAG: hypothetical protein WAK29_01150, partial [Terriglobales bacterium]
NIDSEDFFVRLYHRCHLLKDRLDYLAVCAAVGHELNRDWSLSLQDQFRECIAGRALDPVT